MSVSDKGGVVDFAHRAAAAGHRDRLDRRHRRGAERGGVEVRTVEELTGSPEILGGRVKTLHPRLHAGAARGARRPRALADAGARGDRADRPRLHEPLPVRAHVARRGASEGEVIENIDIGGPTMIRAAAKNHAASRSSSSPETTTRCSRSSRSAAARSRPSTRHWLANEAFAYTARYDAAIAAGSPALRGLPEPLRRRATRSCSTSPTARTRTSGRRSTRASARARTSSPASRKLHGKELSFNNVLDLDSARELLATSTGRRA